MISGVVALTLSPMMSAHLLRAGDEEHGLAGRIAHGFDRLRRMYGHGLGAVLSSRGFVYVVWIVLGVLGFAMIKMAPSELAPAEDQGVIFGFSYADADATVDQTAHYAAAVNKAFFSVPETEFVFQLITPGTSSIPGIGGMVVKPWDDRKRSIFKIMPEVQMKLHAIPGIQIFPVLPPSLPGGGNFPLEFVISSTADFDQILPLAKQIADKATADRLFYFPPLIDVKVDEPQSEVVIDRDKVAALGLNLTQVGSDLAAAMGGNYINFFDIGGRSYKVIPQLKRVERLNPAQLEDVYITGPTPGQLVPLSTVASIRNSTVPRTLNRFQQLNAVTISGVPSKPLDQALTYMEDLSAQILPKGYIIDYTGESRQLRLEGGNAKFWQTMGLAFILIFLVLAAQFNSFRDPFVILFGSVPLALFGAGIFMFLKMPNPNIPFWTAGWTTTFNIYSQVGLVTLVGLISKNGILIVEFANKLQLAGKGKIEAVHEAAMTRLRPVLMTTVATVAGHFPLTLVTGAGAAARNSIGLTLVGGMSIGTIFTLFVVPCVYVLIAKDHAQDRVREKEISRLEAAETAKA
jgi:multidrug efflux pump